MVATVLRIWICFSCHEAEIVRHFWHQMLDFCMAFTAIHGSLKHIFVLMQVEMGGLLVIIGSTLVASLDLMSAKTLASVGLSSPMSHVR